MSEKGTRGNSEEIGGNQEVGFSIPQRTRWTGADLELLPDSINRYEIIDGELFVSRPFSWHHQATSANIAIELHLWSQQSGLGGSCTAPGINFSEIDEVAPDAVWISYQRLAILLDENGHLTGAPELAVEVLPSDLLNGKSDQRDRLAKLKLYESYGVQEYWIADWRLRQVEVYRREQGRLRRVATLLAEDEMTSPLLPGFACRVERFFD